MAARAMGNFALSRLRIVNPRDGWPNVAAQRAAAGADHILDQAELFDTVEQAVADLHAAVRHHRRAPMTRPSRWSRRRSRRGRDRGRMSATGGGVGILFGRERYGLQNEEVALANRIITFPVNPGFASLNLAQAVLLIGYEWFKLSTGRRVAVRDAGALRARPRSTRCRRSSTIWCANSTRSNSCARAEKRETMLVNLRNIFTRMEPTKQDMHTLHGVVMAIAEGRKGPAKGGVLDGEQATRLRALLAEHGQGPALPSDSGTVRGLARLLRRNPTDAERILWQALTTRPPLRRTIQAPDPGRPPYPGFRLLRAPARDRAGQSRASPMPSSPTAPARTAWLEARDYRVIEMRVG